MSAIVANHGAVVATITIAITTEGDIRNISYQKMTKYHGKLRCDIFMSYRNAWELPKPKEKRAIFLFKF